MRWFAQASIALRKALLISPYFVPCNLAGVQRVRLLSSALPQFGWTPIVLTVDQGYYGEAADVQSLHLLAPGLHIERVSAWPTGVCRRLGIGDLSLRAHVTLRRRIKRLVQTANPHLIFVTVLPGYASLLGSWAKEQFNLPLVLDYQDPWVSTWGAAQSKWSKAGVAHRFAEWLEPKVLGHVDAITAVSDQTLDTLRQRNLLPSHIPVEIVPIGADRHDHAVATRHGRSLIQRKPNTFHIAYIGTLTDRMLPALKGFLLGLSLVKRQSDPAIRLHLIGTSGHAKGEDQHNVTALIEERGFAGAFELFPARVGYLDALRTMQDADLLLMLGSTDPHYTASKLFPYWLSGRPIFGLFHAESTILSLSGELGGITLVCYDDRIPASSRIQEVAKALSEIISERSATVPPRNEAAFARYSTEGTAKTYAELFNKVLQRCR